VCAVFLHGVLCGALLGVLCCARWRLGLRLLVLNDQGPSRRSYGSQEIVEPYSIPEQSSAGKGENSTSSCWLFRSFISEDGGSSGNDSNQQVCFPEIELPCVAAVESQAPLFSRSAPHSLRIPSTVVSDDRQCIAPSADTMRMRRFRGNKTRGRDNRWRDRQLLIEPETHPAVGHKHVRKRNEQAEVRKQSQCQFDD